MWKEFRILVIEPGTLHKPLRCAFETISLLDNALPQYETVSYAWGDATKHDIVYVGGHQLNVPISAKRVLQRMRRADKPRTVWIDVICVDQQNLVDRNYLVQLMCEIYSCTSTGFIWLGEDDHNTMATFDAIRALYHEAQSETRDFETFMETVWPGWWNVYGAPTSVAFDAKHMAQLFDNAWFSRLWCVQEAALAPNSIYHCGSQSVPLLHLLRAAIWLHSKTSSLPGPLDVHRGLARAVHIASYADVTFKVPFQAGGNLLWMMNTLRQYSASLDKDHVWDTKANISLKSEEPLDVLAASGFVLDRVKETGLTFTLETLRSVQSFLGLCESIEASIKEIEPRPTGLEHTLIASLDRMRVPTCSEQSMTGYHALKSYLLRRGRFPAAGLVEDDAEARDGHAYLEALSRWLRNRCFFITSTGYIGIGPKVMRDDDLVAILYGSSVPVVLRRKEACPDVFLVVGSAYVTGVMHGEAVEKHRAVGTADLTFRLT
ncbi:hypothetical protein LTS10_005107 [Elasticomyces elasticus]|nr:hypothetical protein LTS10_005107 [Elasticomyces elasticus]